MVSPATDTRKEDIISFHFMFIYLGEGQLRASSLFQ